MQKGDKTVKRIFFAACIMAALLGFTSVQAAELHGVVTDKGGKPVVIQVVLKDAKGVQVGEPVTTDKGGAYAFKDIKPGAYTVAVGKDEWKIFVGPGETRRDFTLK
ncbi:MAG TPA: carboxypeptidase-like regulatory domain-containing protein [Desulfomonilia bacterium]|nr:carboxypeptidase-like regulatory domain-containing protein [Desulfomonilia bacterium]